MLNNIVSEKNILMYDATANGRKLILIAQMVLYTI